MSQRLVSPTKDELVGLISDTLTSRKDDLKSAFEASVNRVGVRYVAIDDLLPAEVAALIAQSFPNNDDMRLTDSFREKKFTSNSFDRLAPILGDVTFAFQDRRIVQIVEDITGIPEQSPDPSLYAGGLSAMTNGHFLGPHLDNSHDASRRYYRTLNLLYYVTPDWEKVNGGNLQLWDRHVSKNVVIHSRFNRLVLMETTPWSWHSVNRIRSDGVRKCVSNYYFSETSPTDEEYFNITAFSAPPSQPVLRAWSKFDAAMRQFLRRIKPSGVGRVDVYEGPPR